MTAACWARLGAHAAIRTRARVAIQRLRCEVAVPPLKCVLRSRRRSFGAANAEKRCGEGIFAEERCGESNSQRLVSNRSRARKSCKICSIEFCGAACQLSIDFGIQFEACCGKFCVYERAQVRIESRKTARRARTPALTFFER